MRKPKKDAPRAQSEAFIEAARELGCDEDAAHFDAVLKKVARHALHKPASKHHAEKQPQMKPRR